MPRTSTIKLRGGTAANIAAANPTPAAREPVYETDTRLLKVGDGSTAFNSLGYVRPYLSATDRLLGRSTAGAGVAEEIACTADARAILAANNVYACRAWVNFDGTAASNLSATYSLSSTTLTVTSNAHGFAVNQQVYLDFTSGTATDGTYTINGVTTNTFTVTHASGTTSGNVTVVRNTIKASGNVSSVADRGVGMYVVNFSTALADNHYAAVACVNSDFASASIVYEDGGSGTRTTLTLPVTVVNSSFAVADRSRINVAVFR